MRSGSIAKRRASCDSLGPSHSPLLLLTVMMTRKWTRREWTAIVVRCGPHLAVATHPRSKLHRLRAVC